MLVEFYFGILLNEMKFPNIESLTVAVVISDSIFPTTVCTSVIRIYKITMSVFRRVADPSLFMEWYAQWVFWPN